MDVSLPFGKSESAENLWNQRQTLGPEGHRGVAGGRLEPGQTLR